MRTTLGLLSALALSACAQSPVTTSPFAPPLRLVGTEPFWAARVDGRTVVLSGADRPTLTARIIDSRISAAGGAYAAEAGSGAGYTAMTVSFDAEACSDGMSDRTYPLKATVVVSRDPDRPAETLRGCAAPEAMLDRSQF